MLKDRFTTQKSYKNKLIQTQPCDFNENIQFNEKGNLKMKHRSLKPLRDFMLHGLEINVIEQKVLYNQTSFFYKDFILAYFSLFMMKKVNLQVVE
jgi:hypothetical protein